MGPDHHDRVLDLVLAAQQPNLDLGVGVVALESGRDEQQAVRTDEGGQHAGAAGQRRRHEAVPDPAEPDPHPVVHAHRRRELAGESRADAWARRSTVPSSRARSGAAKMSKVSAAETG